MKNAYDYLWYDEYTQRVRDSECVKTSDPEMRVFEPIADGDELRAVVEADILLMEYHSERHGCGCSKHPAWRV